MKLNEFLASIFGSDNSKKELEQLSSWQKEGKMNAQILKEMAEINSTSENLKSYKQFDVESALDKSLKNIQGEKSSKKWIYVLAAIAILTLLTISFKYNKISTKSDVQISVASYGTEQKRDDGTYFAVAENSIFNHNAKKNEVSMKGAVYFDVTKQNMPLLIETSNGLITVLGTKFDVFSGENSTEIFMYEGIISFVDSQGESFEVSKNQLLRSSKSSTSIQTLKSYPVISYWRTNTLEYKSESLANVLSDLSRLFNKEFKELDKETSAIEISSIFKNSTLDQILEELEVITGKSLKVK